MFRRREPLQRWHRVREYVWPRAGWVRAFRYVVHRVLRLNDSPYSIAAGLACGAAISFTPFVGFHFVLAALFAWTVRGNIVASAIGTLVGNPWTLPLLLALTYELGHRLLGGASANGLPPDVTLGYLFDHPWQVLLPMLLGSIPSGAVAWVATFFPARILVRRYQALRQKRLAARQAVLASQAAKAAAK